MSNEEVYEPTLLDLCQDQGLTFEQLGASLDPPVSRSLVSRWSRGERSIPLQRVDEIALKLGKSLEVVNRSIEVGTRQYQRRQAYLAQSAPSKPAAKRPRTTSVA